MSPGEIKVAHRFFVHGCLCACIPRDPWCPALHSMRLGGDRCAGVPGMWTPAVPRLPDPGDSDDHRFQLCSGSQRYVSSPTRCPWSLSGQRSGGFCCCCCLFLTPPLVRMVETRQGVHMALWPRIGLLVLVNVHFNIRFWELPSWLLPVCQRLLRSFDLHYQAQCSQHKYFTD